MTRIARLWRQVTMRHRGTIGYILESGPFWMCDRCGAVER